MNDSWEEDLRFKLARRSDGFISRSCFLNCGGMEFPICFLPSSASSTGGVEDEVEKNPVGTDSGVSIPATSLNGIVKSTVGTFFRNRWSRSKKEASDVAT